MRVTLDDIVRSILIAEGRNTLHGYLRIMKFLIDFLRNFSLNHTYLDHHLVLKLDEKKAIQLPDDFLAATTIAWQSGDRIIRFQRDNSINLHQSYCEDVASATANSRYQVFQSWPYNGEGVMVTNDQMLLGNCNLNGNGYNGLGYFRMNWAAREIQFSTDIPTPEEIYLEYKSNGFSAKSKSSLPEFASKVAEDYTRWQLGRMKFGDSASETEARRITYLRTYDDMMAQLDPIDYEAIAGAKARAHHINRMP